MEVSQPFLPDGTLPIKVLISLPDKDLQAMLSHTRYQMRIGAPPVSKEEWMKTCNLECQLKLEKINRHFTGTKIKSLKYGT